MTESDIFEQSLLGLDDETFKTYQAIVDQERAALKEKLATFESKTERAVFRKIYRTLYESLMEQRLIASIELIEDVLVFTLNQWQQGGKAAKLIEQELEFKKTAGASLPRA